MSVKNSECLITTVKFEPREYLGFPFLGLINEFVEYGKKLLVDTE